MSIVKDKVVSDLLRLAMIGYNMQIAELQERRAQLAAMIHEKPQRPAAKVIAPKKRRKLTAAARAKISAAQKARWTEDKKKNAEEARPKTPPPSVQIVKPAPIRVKKKFKAAKPKAAQPKARLIKAAFVPVIEKAEQEAPKMTQSTVELLKTASIPEKKRTEQQKPKAAQSSKPVKAAPEKSEKYPAEKAKFRSSRYAKAVLALQGGGNRTVQTSKSDIATPAGIVEQLALAGARFRITRGGSLIIGNLGSLPPAVQRMFLEHPNPHLLTAAARHHLAAANQASKQ